MSHRPGPPQLMRAWVVHESGEPEAVLSEQERTTPSPAPGQVLIRVAACGLNFPDVLQCRGQYHDRADHPFVPGMEVVGTVVGGAEGLAGRRVIALTQLPDGGLAEYAIASVQNTFEVPADMTDAHAAGFLITYQTAWLAIHRRASARAGETILIHGASGGVGLACVQLAVEAGLRVIATVRSAAKGSVVEGLGADLVIDITATDFITATRNFTEGRGADIVIDPIGGETFDRSTRCIAWEGRLVVVGFMSGVIPSAPANQVLLKNFSVMGLNMGAYPQRHPDAMREAHQALLGLHARGAVVPVLHPLTHPSNPAAALAELVSGQVVGKAVVKAPFSTDQNARRGT